MLERRRSERSFAEPSIEAISILLWHAARAQRATDCAMGYRVSQRPLPSAGALHPIHILVELAPGHGWAVYLPEEHALAVVDGLGASMMPLIQACEDVVPRQDGRLMFFAAEIGKTAAKYDDPESLVWRDAGVLQAGLALVAAGLDMPFCLLGVTGEPWISALTEQGELMGVGVAVFGARV
ncbi:hypothetical protein [Luteimonas saliphila]|uniref:hypothetical protein n=1 Tax=Luteimonas saliphila TaxID=2804919 RepID=UPI00192D5FC0|nr:hypothetical protein [Luteimonas saliphila]